jgi:DNA modification methylase
MLNRCEIGDCREVLRRMIAEGVKVQMCVTSPEPTIEEYVATMVEVFRLVREVLADDGTLWLNMGDAYAQSGGQLRGVNETRDKAVSRQAARGTSTGQHGGWESRASRAAHTAVSGLKPKDLCGIPWRVAFALQADGWYLRSDIIWHKPNPMPESCEDRPTKAHEYLFLLTKGPRYYYDAEAVREPSTNLASGNVNTNVFAVVDPKRGATRANLHKIPARETRNRRTVWTIATEAFPDAHFATFPRKLVEPCILAGTSERGHCPECGKRWERVSEKEFVITAGTGRKGRSMRRSDGEGLGLTRGTSNPTGYSTSKALGFRPTCTHNLDPVADVVLDPFLGSGTVTEVAQHLGRRWIGIDLNPSYSPMQERRTAQTALALGS